MQNIEYLKDQNVVLVPIKQWEKLQSELVRLKKRVNKADILSDLKKSLTELKSDLQNESYDATVETSADDFIAQLKNEQ